MGGRPDEVSEPDMQLYDLRVTVEEIGGRSVCGLSVGDYIEVTCSSQLRMPPGGHFCLYALAAALAAAAGQAAPTARGGLARARQLVACPDPGGTPDHANHSDRPALDAGVRPHLTMAEIGIAFQTDKPPGRYGELARAAEAHGFDVVSVFADLLYQPPLPALLEMARATSGCGSERPASTPTPSIRTRSPARSRRSMQPPAAVPTWVWPEVPGSMRSASVSSAR